MSSTRTVAAWNVVPILAYAEARGLAREEAVRRFALDTAALADVDGRVPLATYGRLWRELPGMLGDPDMPLHVSAHVTMSEPPLNALIALASPTFGDALSRLARYQRITFDVGDDPVSDVVVDGDEARIVVFHDRGDMVPPTGAVIDSCLGIRMLAVVATGEPLVPIRASFRHPEPADRAPYEAAMGCPIAFGADADELVLKAADLARPHLEASRTLLAITERHAERVLDGLPALDPIVIEARRAIRERLPDGAIDLGALSETLGTSARTMQRRLQQAETSLRQLVDEERRDLAMLHIQNPRTPLIDIAFAIGFSDQASFTRAFVRWTSQTPSAWRAGTSAPP